MEKPRNIPLRNFIQKRISVELAISEDVIDKVITHCFSSASRAMLTNNTVEISGWGKFIFDKKRMFKHISKLEDTIKKHELLIQDGQISEKQKIGSQKKIDGANKDLLVLKQRMTTYES